MHAFGSYTKFVYRVVFTLLCLFRLQIPIFFSYVLIAWTFFPWVQVAMPYYHGAGVTLMQFLE